MMQWQSVSLGEAVELAYGKSLPKSSRVESGTVPVYGSNGITGWHDTSVVDGPTIIVGRKGSAGAVQFVDGPCFPIDTTYFARPRKGFEFDIKFLYYMLRQLDLSRLKTATGVPGLTREDAYRETIRVPPLSEQCSIVDLLSRADGIVRLRREAEKKAAELIPALFLDMFGDPATNPKGWPVAKVGDVLDAADYGSSSKASADAAGLPMIRMGNVTYEGNLDLANLKYVDLAAEEVERYSLRSGDILFNRTNSKELVGKTGVWDGSFEAIVASYFIRLRVKQDAVRPHYLWAFMNTAHMKRLIFDTARGAIGQSNINSKELKAFPLPVPPLSLQERFALRCADVSGMVVQQSTATAKAQATFDSLLEKTFA